MELSEDDFAIVHVVSKTFRTYSYLLQFLNFDTHTRM